MTSPQTQIASSLSDALEDRGDNDNKFLTFCLGQEEYGVVILKVREIIGIIGITPVPQLPEYVKGVINLRGKVIPVIDVRLRFGLEERAYNDRTCFIVVRLNNISIGLIVDTVSEVMDIPASDIEPPPKVNKGAASRYIKALGKVDENVKILLDSHKLLFDDEVEQISESMAA